ncbi:transposase [Cystobacter fuscus]
MTRKLSTKRGRKAYARRKVTAEPVIGQVKNGVLPRFSLRGLTKVRGNSRWHAPSTTSRSCGSRAGNFPALPRRPRSGEVAARRATGLGTPPPVPLRLWRHMAPAMRYRTAG